MRIVLHTGSILGFLPFTFTLTFTTFFGISAYQAGPEDFLALGFLYHVVTSVEYSRARQIPNSSVARCLVLYELLPPRLRAHANGTDNLRGSGTDTASRTREEQNHSAGSGRQNQRKILEQGSPSSTRHQFLILISYGRLCRKSGCVFACTIS